uniref:G_PROTEIN_RECEP_F1_2 domain-containing protein n=1 Tax=Haemonchus contortus TaxID=6289 RepID=A0A7I5E597_HAECO
MSSKKKLEDILGVPLKIGFPLEKLDLDAARLQSLKQLILRMSSGEQNGVDFMEPPAIEWMMLHHLAIILLTIIGNCLLIYVILKNNTVRRRKRVTPVQMLMLHMCAADLLFALITMVPTMAITATVPIFYGPDILCKFVKFLQVLPMYASSFLLVAISADRFQAICRPLASMKSNAYKRPALYASIAWTMAVLFSTPQFGLFAKIEGDCMGTYTSAYQYAIYVTVFNTVVWLLPSALAGYLYYRVCRAVWQSTSFGSNFQTNGKCASMIPSGGQVHHKGATMQCVELDRRRLQTVKLTLTIVAANFILWAPFCITSVIDALWPTAINPTFATYIMFFGNLNSFVNPWIWFYFNQAQFKRALPCVRRKEAALLGNCSARRTMDGITDNSIENQQLTDSKS